VRAQLAPFLPCITLFADAVRLQDVPIYGVTNRSFDGHLPITVCVEGGPNSVEQWRILNPIWICNASEPNCLSTMDRQAAAGALRTTYLQPVSLSHGFHMHTFKFQVVNDSNGGVSHDYELGDWRDTATTPMAGWVEVRWLADGFDGLVPYHCHMSPHSDRGMVAVAQVAGQCPLPAPARAANRQALLDHHRQGLGASGWEPPLSNFTWPITTSSARAQALFDEAIQLAYGFAHDAAASVFAEALAADPSCAMCAWGVGLCQRALAKPPGLQHRGLRGGGSLRNAGLQSEPDAAADPGRAAGNRQHAGSLLG
jgi:hypothetical protein